MSKEDSGEYGHSCNACVNGPMGKVLGDKGATKSTTGGKDIGPNATNSMGKFSNTMLSPNSEAASATNKRTR